MVITIHHRKAWTWVIPPVGDVIGESEPTMPVDDSAPHVVRVKRLQDMNTTTTVEIPDESVTRMAYERAWKELSPESQEAGTQPTVTRRHVNAAVAQHVEDIVHKHHAPVEHWSDITVDSDPLVQKHLRTIYLDSERGNEAGEE